MIIGICGGTGSGKTTVANRILESVRADEVVFIQQDLYYRDLKDMPLDYRNAANFDHPDAFDHELLKRHIRELLAGHPIEQPIYDYSQHRRLGETRMIGEHLVIVLEGILIFGLGVATSPTDVLTFAGVSAVFLTVAAVACFIPARQVTAIDPLIALRQE